MENTTIENREKDYLLPDLPELLECFMDSSEKFFSFLKDDFQFDDIFGIYHYEYNPAKLILIDFEKLKGRKFVVAGREFYNEEGRIELLYGTLGLNGTGDERIHLNIRYQTKNDCFKIIDILHESGVLTCELNMKNIESCELLIQTLRIMGEYIKNNMSLFTKSNDKVLKKLIKKQDLMRKKALEQYIEMSRNVQ